MGFALPPRLAELEQAVPAAISPARRMAPPPGRVQLYCRSCGREFRGTVEFYREAHAPECSVKALCSVRVTR